MSASSLGFGSCTTVGSTSAGALSQLVAVGSSDTWLTADPDVTYWRARVERCTNFSMDTTTVTFNGTPALGSEVVATLPKTADLLYWIYLVVDIPAICGKVAPSGASSLCSSAGRYPVIPADCDPCGDGNVPTDCNNCCPDDVEDDIELFDDLIDDSFDQCSGLKRPYAHWVNSIGYALVNRICFQIGGQVVDSVYGYFMEMWAEIAYRPGLKTDEMVGKRYTRQQLVEDSKHNRRLYIPIPFWFTQHSGNALPIASLQFHNLQMAVGFTSLQSLIQVSDADVTVVNCNTGSPVAPADIRAYLLLTNIYLDMQERDAFSCGAFQQLITQHQSYSTTTTSSTIRAQLNLNHPVTCLIFSFQRKCMQDANERFNFSGPGGTDIMTRAALRINNLPRFEADAKYFRLVQPWQYFSSIPTGFIYVYSFALQPESCMPSGSLNFSRIDSTEFLVELSDLVAGEQITLLLFAINYNILRYRNGLSGLIYSS